MKKIQIVNEPFKGIRIPHWPVTEMCGYEPKTTFWQDFWIAIHFGKEAVLDTYKRAFNEWKSDHIYVTELALVLNHLVWALYEKDEDLARTFQQLYEQTDSWVWENLPEDEKVYYWRTLD